VQICSALAMHSALDLLYPREFGGFMLRLKDETLSIRISSEIKQILRRAAVREHRSVASTVEVLVLAICA
jgi:hypothetical protein